MEKQYKENTIRHWFIGNFEYENKTYQVVYGNFYNRPRIYDGMSSRTSPIQEVKICPEENEYQIRTMNRVYHCSFESCFFEQQDNSSFELTDYKKIREKYYIPTDKTSLGNNDMLLVVADYTDYYFKELVYFDKNGEAGDYASNVHLGMLVDTYLIYSKNREIDIRWYVEISGFEFYSLDIGNRNLWIENAGDSSLLIKARDRIIDLKPKERQKYLMKSLLRKLMKN